MSKEKNQIEHEKQIIEFNARAKALEISAVMVKNVMEKCFTKDKYNEYEASYEALDLFFQVAKLNVEFLKTGEVKSLKVEDELK